MAKFKTYDYRQRVLLPVSLEDQLMSGTLEFAIHTLVEKRSQLYSQQTPAGPLSFWSQASVRKLKTSIAKKAKEAKKGGGGGSENLDMAM